MKFQQIWNSHVSIDCAVDISVLENCTELVITFLGANSESILYSLKRRFDDLPIQKLCYYQSYNNITSDALNNAIEMKISQRRSKLNPTGMQAARLFGDDSSSHLGMLNQTERRNVSVID